MYDTGRVEDVLNTCGDIQELRDRLLPLLTDQRTAWTQKISSIMDERGLSCGRMAKLCRVSEPAVRKWKNGALPQSRDMFIRIGFAAGYDLREMNHFLQRYGRCPQLYEKSLEDSVCIFILRSAPELRTYEEYLKLLDAVRQEMQSGGDGSGAEVYSTVCMSEHLSCVNTNEEMLDFVQKYAASYRQAYTQLYSYVNMYLALNLSGEYAMEGDSRRASFHAMANESRWSSSLRHVISEIQQKKWFPLRHKVISLGLHLNMDVESINQMLTLAKMEPLYVKNPVEAAVIWAVEEACLSAEEGMLIPSGTAELCGFVRNVLLDLGLAESAVYLLNDL